MYFLKHVFWIIFNPTKTAALMNCIFKAQIGDLTHKCKHKSVHFKVAAGEIDRGYTWHELQRSMLKIRHKR